MTTFYVSCINKRNRQSPYERITHLGGITPFGWKYTSGEVMQRKRNGDMFIVAYPGRPQVEVIIAKRNDVPYLKTQTDYKEPNNLLSLPECG